MKLFETLYKYLRFWGGEYRCNICSTRVRKFFPLSSDLQRRAKANGFLFDFKRLETLNYEQCNCPFCMSSDRERLYILYLEKYLSSTTKRYSILDFAPNAAFSKLLRARNYDYTSTDFYRADVDIRMNICDMKEVLDNQFDFVICSHILEHVPDPDKAIREVLRILKPEGKAIIMVPLFWDVKETIEDPSHNTDELRLRYYGQDDHVRLFSRNDFLNRLHTAGFKISQLKPDDFDPHDIRENAIAENSILYVCQKNKGMLS